MYLAPRGATTRVGCEWGITKGGKVEKEEVQGATGQIVLEVGHMAEEGARKLLYVHLAAAVQHPIGGGDIHILIISARGKKKWRAQTCCIQIFRGSWRGGWGVRRNRMRVSQENG